MTSWPSLDLKETQIQSIAFQHLDLLAKRDPRYLLIYAVPNGGKRSVITGARMKREGCRRGVPDICVDYAAHGYHGLRIEVKVPGKSPSPEQREWKRRLEGAGYCHGYCYSVDDILNLIGGYFARQVFETWLVDLCRYGLERNRSGQVVTTTDDGAVASTPGKVSRARRKSTQCT